MFLMRTLRHNIQIILTIEAFLIMLTITYVFAATAEDVNTTKLVSTNQAAELVWDHINTNNYQIYKSNDGLTYEKIGETSKNYYTDTTFDENTHSYVVTAYNNVKNGIPTSKATIVYVEDSDKDIAESEILSEEDAVIFLRKAMVNRIQKVVLYVDSIDKDLYEKIYEQAIEHTGNPKEGDYLKFQLYEYIAQHKVQDGITEIHYNLQYYSTKAQEEEVDIAVENILNDLHLEKKSDYEKIKCVYNYLKKNLEYDTEIYEDNNIKRTAYSALIKNNTVCQGYSLAMYKLLLEAGVDTRIVYGVGVPEIGTPTPHTWNIVKCDGKYYNLDVTSDDTMDTFFFNLNSSGDFDESHVKTEEYASKEFNEKYPIAEDGLTTKAPSLGKYTLALLNAIDN